MWTQDQRSIFHKMSTWILPGECFFLFPLLPRPELSCSLQPTRNAKMSGYSPWGYLCMSGWLNSHVRLMNSVLQLIRYLCVFPEDFDLIFTHSVQVHVKTYVWGAQRWGVPQNCYGACCTPFYLAKKIKLLYLLPSTPRKETNKTPYVWALRTEPRVSCSSFKEPGFRVLHSLHKESAPQALCLPLLPPSALCA